MWKETLKFIKRLLCRELYIQNYIKEDGMTKRERDALIERVNGMSEEELKVVSEIIPVELCIARISNELISAKIFREKVENACEVNL